MVLRAVFKNQYVSGKHKIKTKKLLASAFLPSTPPLLKNNLVCEKGVVRYSTNSEFKVDVLTAFV
jgi:hypothetical protein